MEGEHIDPRANQVEYLDRHSLDSAVGAVIAKTALALGISRAVGQSKRESKI